MTDEQNDGFPEFNKPKDIKLKECNYCLNLYTQETVEKMDREKLPCVCGVATTEFEPAWVPHEGYATTWDAFLELIADSGMWRCTACGFTATRGNWDETDVGGFAECPGCQAVEDYEILDLSGIK